MAARLKKNERALRWSRSMALVRLWLAIGAVAVVVVLAAVELAALGGRGGITRRFLGAHGVSVRATEIDRAVSGALVRLGVHSVVGRDDARGDGEASWVHRKIEGRIPVGVGLYEVNLTITRAVHAAGGRVQKAREFGVDVPGRRTLSMCVGIGATETHAIILREDAGESETAFAAAGDVEPSIAIIIDDFGYNESATTLGFIESSLPITVSVLPYCPHTRQVAEAARRAGKEVLVHLPMEPAGYPDVDPGPNALLSGHSSSEIRRLAREAIAEVPGAVGVNNHMGSTFTRSARRMRAVAEAVGEAGLFYIDSMTTPFSEGYAEASGAGLRTARNRMFIDSQLDESGRIDVRAQLLELERIARRGGRVIGIGHPHEETLEVLEDMIPKLQARGVRFVPASEIVE